jgi:hypothetical protein
VIVSQGTVLAADHPQPLAVRISKAPSVAPDGPDADVGDSENVQPCPWLTVNVRPAIVSVPDRAGPLVAATLKVTLPAPLPFAPAVIVIHGALFDAVHAQPPPAATDTVPVPPVAGMLWTSGDIAYVQP